MAAALGRRARRGIDGRGLRRPVPGGRPPLPRGAAWRAPASRRSSRSGDGRRPRWRGRCSPAACARASPASTRARCPRRFAGRAFDARAARRPAAGRRSLRRERRVPHLRLGRPDVRAPGGGARRRGGRARRVRVRGPAPGGSRAQRIASLLASGTELVCALGLGDELVGAIARVRSPGLGHARCRAISRPTFDITGASGEIDARVRAKLRAGEPLYEVDEAVLAALGPDVIITQTHCEVCAVSAGDLAHGAPARLRAPAGRRARNRHARRMLEGFEKVAAVIGAPEAGRALVDGMRARLAALAATTAPLPRPARRVPRVDGAAVRHGQLGTGAGRDRGRPLRAGQGGRALDVGRPGRRWRTPTPTSGHRAVRLRTGTRAGRDAGARRARRLAGPAGRARRPRVRRRRQPLLQPLGPAAVRHAATSSPRSLHPDRFPPAHGGRVWRRYD